MEDREALKACIRSAFAGVEYPGDWCLRGSDEGEEPFLLEADFKGKEDRYALEAAFLDQAPDGFSSALNFFSDEAFCFYLPAYLLADLDGLLECVDPTHCLTHGLDDAYRAERINPRRYGERTWFDYKRYKFAMFDSAQCAAITAYLEARREDAETAFERDPITQALDAYWLKRAC